MTSTATPGDIAAVEYDPFAPESMVDPRPVYARLREAGDIHYLPKYDAWAFASFEAVWTVTRDVKNFTTENRGMPPISSLLQEPSMVNFTATNNRDHSASRRLLQKAYRQPAAEMDTEFMRGLAREVLDEILARGDGKMDILTEYASRVASRFAGQKVGIPIEDAEYVRTRCADFFHREYGQVGTSEVNGAAAGEVFGYLQDLLAEARRDPESARGDLAVMLSGEIHGRPFTDDEILGNLFTLIVTGSETTETAAASALYYLAENPDQLADVLADRSLIPAALLETIRYDHPTDILCREVLNEVEMFGETLRPGQQIIMMWGSAGRDEKEYENADVFDIHRTYERHLLFGNGQHRCLGEHTAIRLGTVLIEEFLNSVESYEVEWTGCRRRYAEFVQGFVEIPVRYVPGKR